MAPNSGVLLKYLISGCRMGEDSGNACYIQWVVDCPSQFTTYGHEGLPAQGLRSARVEGSFLPDMSRGDIMGSDLSMSQDKVLAFNSDSQRSWGIMINLER